MNRADDRLALNIVGAGKVGQTLGRLWRQSGVFAIRDVLNNSLASSEAAVAFIGAGRAIGELSAAGTAEAWMIATSDDRIEEICGRLAAAGKFDGAQVVFHCSGALSSAVLHAAQACGAQVASLHPIRSFADREQAAQHFPGTWCGIEGNDSAVQRLHAACAAIGGRPLMLQSNRKMLYHGAAVFASNYLVSLLDVALRTYEAAGVPEAVARQLLEPLVRGAVDNVFRLGTEAALTGPIARGDLAAARRQQEAVAGWDAEYGALYEDFIAATCRLASRREKS